MKTEEQLRAQFEKLNNDSWGFRRNPRGLYVNPSVRRDWKWFLLGSGILADSFLEEKEIIEEKTKQVKKMHEFAFELIEKEYIKLSDVEYHWRGRYNMEGQQKLCRLRNIIAEVTGRRLRDVQDDYGARAGIARKEKLISNKKRRGKSKRI